MSKFQVVNPYDLSILKELSKTPKEEALKALDKAYALYSDKTKWLNKKQRIEILKKAQELFTQHLSKLALQAASEGGKPLTDSLVEVQRGIEGIEVALHELHHLAGEEIPMGLTASSQNRMALTYHQPRGVVLSISAFNHPFNLAIHQIIPAIAVGCPVLIKPASATPLSCHSILEILREAGLPEGWCQVILTSNQDTETILSDPRISFLSFIGSANVGWYLRSKLPPGAACALEHGGVAPVIFDKTAHIEKAIPLLVKGGFYHAGQVCVSVQRIYLDQEIAKDFITPFVLAVKKLKVGNPADKNTEVGPLISPKEVDRIDNWVKEAVEKGAELLCGGKKVSQTCYEPTVILNPPDEVSISCQEVFGPVVVIYTYDDRQKAIARANKPHVFFQTAVFTQDLDVALDASQKLNGRAVMVNDHTAFRVDWMPFGGHLSSGLGVGGIGHSMRDMTIKKMLVFKSDSLQI